MISNIDVCTSDNYITKNTPKVIIMDFNDLISIDTESLFDLLDLPQVVDNDHIKEILSRFSRNFWRSSSTPLL